MTPQNQIKALAELDGEKSEWFCVTCNTKHTYPSTNNHVKFCVKCNKQTSHNPLFKPYLTSCDAIIPLRVKVCNTPALKVAWLNHARIIIARCIKLVSDFDIASIKPDEDCEALLRATGKWHD